VGLKEQGVIGFTVFGEPASKSNSRRLVKRGSRPMFIKSQKALDYGEAFAAQCPQLDEVIEHPVYVVMTIWYASRRPDIDGGVSLVLDLMQGKIYKNDRQVHCIIASKKLDRENPRVEVEVRKYDPMDG